jgi:hypothetical protein
MEDEPLHKTRASRGFQQSGQQYVHGHCLATEQHHSMVVLGIYIELHALADRFCGLVVRVLDYRSGGPGSIPGTNKKKINGSGTGSTQPREYN